MRDIKCPTCGHPGPHARGEGAGPHYARLQCNACGKFLLWLPKPQHASHVLSYYLARTTDYIIALLQPLPAGSLHALEAQHAPLLRWERAVDLAVLAEDVEGTRDTCRAWMRAWKEAVEDQGEVIR